MSEIFWLKSRKTHCSKNVCWGVTKYSFFVTESGTVGLRIKPWVILSKVQCYQRSTPTSAIVFWSTHGKNFREPLRALSTNPCFLQHHLDLHSTFRLMWTCSKQLAQRVPDLLMCEPDFIWSPNARSNALSTSFYSPLAPYSIKRRVGLQQARWLCLALEWDDDPSLDKKAAGFAIFFLDARSQEKLLKTRSCIGREGAPRFSSACARRKSYSECAPVGFLKTRKIRRTRVLPTLIDGPRCLRQSSASWKLRQRCVYFRLANPVERRVLQLSAITQNVARAFSSCLNDASSPVCSREF